MLAAAAPVAAQTETCEPASNSAAVMAALVEIEAGIDPCGETVAVRDLIDEFRQCARGGLRICADRQSERNFIERAPTTDAATPTTIVWNPSLRSELEWGCDGDPAKPVRRDPVASLLHELVHAVQDCAGLDPAEHEFEAVRIENIYRRSRQLCQRTRYGEQPLPAPMLVACEPTNCVCSSKGQLMAGHPAPPAGIQAGDSAGDTTR